MAIDLEVETVDRREDSKDLAVERPLHAVFDNTEGLFCRFLWAL